MEQTNSYQSEQDKKNKNGRTIEFILIAIIIFLLLFNLYLRWATANKCDVAVLENAAQQVMLLV